MLDETQQDMDPIAFRVLWGRLVGVVEEAGAILRRTAFSTIVSEGNDCTAVLFDAAGQELAEPVSFTATSFIGTIPRSMKIFRSMVPFEEWREGDVFICNDPWICTGHMFDICLAAPIYHEGRLVALIMTCCHTANIGGSGRMDAQSVFEEGLRIPFCRLYREGRPQEDVLSFIRANVPMPKQVIGDITSQLNAIRATRDRVGEIMEELRLNDLRPLGRMIARTCSAAMKKSILGLSPGEYDYSLVTDGLEQELLIKCRVKLPGDGKILIDYTGTSPQVKSAINSPIHYTIARTFYALKALFLPETPGNEATFAGVELVVPSGTILNPDEPFPTAFRSLMGHFVPSAVMGALAQAAPDRVLAEGAGPAWSFTVAGERKAGYPFSARIMLGCGQGASNLHDGMDCVTYPGNPANTSAEILERQYGIRVESKSLRRDSGGAGKHRGGWGQRIEIHVVNATPIRFGIQAGRTKVPAPGLQGGGPGLVGTVTLNGNAVDIRRPIHATTGHRLVIETPGGGGAGPAA